MAKIFGKSQGRAHFQQLDSRDFDTNSMLSVFIFVENTVSVADICEPTCWGPQPRLIRGTILRVLRVDDAWFGEFVCTGSSAGYPVFKPVKIAELRPAASEQPVNLGADGVRFLPGAGFVVTLGGEIVSAKATKEEAEQALAEHMAKAAA